MAQWPGCSQPSEYVRRPEWNFYTRQSLREHGFFWLISGGPVRPHLEGFAPVEMIRLAFDLDRGLVVTKDSAARPNELSDAQEPIHCWYATRYRVADTPRP